MSTNFSQTIIGHKFFESDVPRIIKALEKIGDNLEIIAKNTTVPQMSQTPKAPAVKVTPKLNKTRKFKVTHIQYDIGEEDKTENLNLPSELVVQLQNVEEEGINHAICEIITEKTGFCVQGFKYKEYLNNKGVAEK